MKRLHRSSLLATFVAFSCAIGAPYIVKAENLQDFGVSKTTISDDQNLLAQAATAEKKAARKPKVNVDKNGVILHGYDAVAYVELNRAAKGDPKFSSTYRTATYYFASAANKAAFDKNPAKYAPQYGGFCAVSMSRGKLESRIDPNVFFVHKGRLYVCSSAEGAKRFLLNPDVNIQKADKNWETYEPPSNPGFRRYLGG